MRMPARFDHDLRRAEHMAGGLEGDGGVADPHRLAEGGRLLSSPAKSSP